MPRGEVSTKEVLHDAFKRGKRIFVPYIYKPSSQDFYEKSNARSVMDMVALCSVEDYESLEPDAWGIPSVPKESVDERHRVLGKNAETLASEENPDSKSSQETGLTSGELDIIVMPGVAFDGGLRRLGHGKGFYDYFLECYRRSKAGPMPFLGMLDFILAPSTVLSQV